MCSENEFPTKEFTPLTPPVRSAAKFCTIWCAKQLQMFFSKPKWLEKHGQKRLHNDNKMNHLSWG